MRVHIRDSQHSEERFSLPLEARRSVRNVAFLRIDEIADVRYEAHLAAA